MTYADNLACATCVGDRIVRATRDAPGVGMPARRMCTQCHKPRPIQGSGGKPWRCAQCRTKLPKGELK